LKPRSISKKHRVGEGGLEEGLIGYFDVFNLTGKVCGKGSAARADENKLSA
jgi:hypothetical protein